MAVPAPAPCPGRISLRCILAYGRYGPGRAPRKGLHERFGGTAIAFFGARPYRCGRIREDLLREHPGQVVNHFGSPVICAAKPGERPVPLAQAHGFGPGVQGRDAVVGGFPVQAGG